jgi:hypothetical protein
MIENIESSEEEIKPKKESTYKDKLKCEICNKEYTRSNISGHKKTNHHKLHEKFIKIIRNTVMGHENKKTLDDMIKKPYKNNDNETIYMTNKQYNFYKSLPNNNIL